MKNCNRFLALILALCMIFAFTACGTQPAEPTQEPTQATEAVEAGIAGTYHFEHVDEYGDTSRFSIKLRNDGTFTVMTSVGPLGDNICNGTQWTDNGDGTFTTGATDNVLELDFIAEDGTIVWTMLDEEGNVSPVGYTEPTEFLEKPVEEEEEAGPVGGVYTYLESGLAPFDTLWTLTLNEDGTYVLSEENERAGLTEYTGAYTIEGSTVICGPMGETQPGLFSWSNPEGFTVTTGATTFAPVGVDGVELAEEPAEAVPAGVVTKLPEITTFTYVESGLAPFDTLWTLTLNEDGTYVLSEENERAGLVEYPGVSYTRDGNTVVCGPMGDSRPGLFSWSDPEGFTVIIDGENFTPVQTEE